ncbi:hypothetical protein SARC_02402 [Sphaeroforma arctica JP610]|uniref:Uncharacterized protein n=1 Tax=Sphaeroforma arctica JP610 TaxID=667725 RepID=A0A0L0GAW0_9EUKA|nr:hypothetical protein SARC_02402 [Sphaeroforma arctica JP610]KNC85403.1 hypothetical protein SARC_02402 [Sphaeroforma arctica JP610]|eukprot:XP_014159305.1 hypothetical protein SARC_02402 [Sphaeroforma arctica JP610]
MSSHGGSRQNSGRKQSEKTPKSQEDLRRAQANAKRMFNIRQPAAVETYSTTLAIQTDTTLITTTNPATSLSNTVSLQLLIHFLTNESESISILHTHRTIQINLIKEIQLSRVQRHS